MKTLIFNKLVIGILIGFVLSTTLSYANRIPKPTKVISTSPESLSALNETLDDIWEVLNGRFSPNSGAAASSGTGTIKMGSTSNANSAGFLKFEKTDGTVVYVPYFNTDQP